MLIMELPNSNGKSKYLQAAERDLRKYMEAYIRRPLDEYYEILTQNMDRYHEMWTLDAGMAFDKAIGPENLPENPPPTGVGSA